ncbi:MAG: recombination protein RecR [Flavobacteriales bacterium]|nr:recombination protein RecR [Flavobacteriales bacterium]MBL4735410.1 recombination protein RecR [Flavobacteriales bacterium]
MNFSSKLLENAVNEFARLPGVGKRSALRLVLHLMREDEDQVVSLGESLIKMRKEITYCQECHNICDADTCEICKDTSRDKSLICVVEDIRDIMAIENTRQYKGVYHVLGGIISPMNGIGPDDLSIASLLLKVNEGEIKEVILALNTTLEGDTTNFFLFKKLKDANVEITTIARGIAVGDELEYVDDVTLGRSMMNRTPYETVLAISVPR